MPVDLVQTSGPDDQQRLADAAAILASGGLVIFPTETVYGVAANAANEDAVKRLRAVKGRAGEQPFTVHVGSLDQARTFVGEPSNVARRMMAKGWPGPLTLLFGVDDPRQTAIYPQLSEAGRDAIFRENRVGIRFPDEANAAAMLKMAGVPIIASSANRAGQPPPVDAAAAAEQLGADVDLILDGGRCRYGKASTIVSLNGAGFQIVREGVYDARTVQRLTTLNILFICTGNTCRSPMAAAICRSMIAAKLGRTPDQVSERGVSITSCGIGAMADMPAARHAVDVLRAREIDLSSHRSQPATPTLLQSADYIFTMTGSHRDAALDLSPQSAERVQLLDAAGDIPDPVGGDTEEYVASADRIAGALEKRLAELPI